MKQESGTKKEKILTIAVIVLSLIIVFGGAFFASELKYCEVKEVKEVDLNVVNMDQFNKLLSSSDASIVYIARPTCGFCQRQEPIVKNIASEYNLEVNYLNTDELTSSDMQSLFKVDEELFGKDGEDFGTPTTVIVKNGKIIDSLVGYTERDKFVQFLNNYGFIK